MIVKNWLFLPLASTMDFSQVYGNEKVKKHLQDALKKGRIPHAQIFCGPEGSGLLPMALAYVSTIIRHIKHGEWVDVPNTLSDTKLEKLVHPDVHFSFPINKTESISGDKLVSNDFIHLWREAVLQMPYMSLNAWNNHIRLLKTKGSISVAESASIMKKLTLKPFESEYKFMIIWRAEYLHPSAANKLLKLLEEPPEKTIFILIAESTDRMLSTILSRCQLMQFSRINKSAMQEALGEKYSLSSDKLSTILKLSNGNLNLANNLLSEDKQIEFNRDYFANWMRLCFKKDITGIYKWINKISGENREHLKLFFEYGLHVFRESLLINYGNRENQVEEETKENTFIMNFSKYVTASNCMEFVSSFEEAIQDIDRNCNPKIVLMDMSLTLLTKIHPKK